MNVTIVIATYNGADTLPRFLEAYREIEHRGIENCNLIIADNASSDDTREIVSKFARDLPIDYYYEPRQGKNIALNSVIRHFEAELIIFTDDDVIPEPAWLSEFVSCAKKNSEYSIFGGSIRPAWDTHPPEWILNYVPLQVAYGLTDRSLPEGPVSTGLIYGANMAVRTTIFGEGHRFDESVGPQGNHYAMGSETEFLRRLEVSGYRAWHCPNAIVSHIVRADQLEKNWIFGRAFRYGRGQYLELNSKDDSQRVMNIPRWMLRRAGEAFMRATWARLTRRRNVHLESAWDYHALRGQIYEALRDR